MVPVPGWPGFGPYPGLVLTRMMWTMSPEMTGPFFVMWLETITAITAGTVFGGCGLLPGRVVQGCPHHGEALPISSPLELARARPVLRGSLFHHWAPHQY